MAFDYASIAATVYRLLQQFGKAVTLRRIEPGVYDLNTDTVTPSETNVAGFGAVLPYPPNISERSGGSIISTDEQLLFFPTAAIAFDPSAMNKVIIGSESFKVMNAEILRPANTAVLFTFQLRKA
jgi:hypothetical protein